MTDGSTMPLVSSEMYDLMVLACMLAWAIMAVGCLLGALVRLAWRRVTFRGFWYTP